MTIWKQRDASWYANPNVEGVKKFHIESASGRSICGAIQILADFTATRDPPKLLRCERCLRSRHWTEGRTSE